MEPILFTVKELAEYLNIGRTKARELLLTPSCPFCVRIGNRLYAHREELEKWLRLRIKG